MGAVLTSLIGSRFGMAGVVAAILGLVIGGLLLDRSSLKAEVAERDAQIGKLQADIEAQNAAVERMKADALSAQTAADARARVALRPRAKPDTATVERLNSWLTSN
ncbi:hypothetical protein E6C67_08495 [Azospirillum sp. TSA2s]|uniref:hypothetical protein n=1 Tax=Azospirillum sp. TSA2s TaxID=709810 RepID=UPI0010AA6A1E|nr:hypothetical protein [Azospirillum sp. TSA2s]QCG93977.1 hypothetical protein E6C67_08495 [Azospirillum sp. TSA2s]